MQLLNARELFARVQRSKNGDPGLSDPQPSRPELRDGAFERRRAPRASVESGSGNFRGFERINWGKPVTCVALICRHFLLGDFPKAGAGK